MDDKEKLKQQAQALIEATKALGDVIRELGSIPNGHLYAQVMDKLSLETYTALINLLKEARLVKESNHLLTWIGKK